MSRVKYQTNIDITLLSMAKAKAKAEGLSGANAVIEDALRV